MRLKSYFAASVEGALRQARQELGDEALLLESRSAGPTSRHMGKYEVVFALAEQGQTPGNENGVEPAVAVNSSARGGRAEEAGISRELADMRRELDSMKTSARGSSLSFQAQGLLAEPDLADLYRGLLACDVLPDMARDLVLACARQPVRSRSGQIERRLLADAFRVELAARLETSDMGERARNPQQAARPIAFVGPSGAGKTLTLAKLAVQFGLPSRRPICFVSLDNYRVGGSAQLRTFAELLGVQMQALDSPKHLGEFLDDKRRHWIWIDTPGFAVNDGDALQELADGMRSHSSIETHLVLSATMKSADLKSAVERFRRFDPDHVLLTHLDETASHGGILTALSCTGKPISFLCSGQSIPEDVVAAERGQLAQLLLTQIQAGADWALRDGAQAKAVASG